MTDVHMKSLLRGVDATPLGESDPTVSGVAYRSDAVSPGDAFFCIRGFAHDGHDFAEDAVARGASALVVERALSDVDAPQFLVSDTRVALALRGRRVLRPPQPNDEPHRDHRHQRKDHHDLPA